MEMTFTPLEPLASAVPASDLFRDWIGGGIDADFLGPVHRRASLELESALGQPPADRVVSGEPAPLFGSPWVAGWAEAHDADCAEAADRKRFRSQVAALKAGAAEVVVTGQQPGFLGGPMYTLYKIATAVVLADRMSAAGRPAVPVFWSGDDDDDLAEALAAVAWDPGQQRLRGAASAPRMAGSKARPPVLGRMGEGPWKEDAAIFLAGIPDLLDDGGGRLAGDLAAIWTRARHEGWNWTRLSRRAILRLFAGRGLVVVSGDDPGLHAAAGPLYQRILTGRRDLSRLADEQGRRLEAGGWHAQISPRSLARPLFMIEDDRRVPLEGRQAGADPDRLRPGVMLRSPVQDWLVRPAAVVVGPGELAYLRQIDPLYDHLDIVRSPLVPRLFGWLVPPGFDVREIARFRNLPASANDLAARLAAEAGESASRTLAETLERELGLEAARARSLAAGRARRWSKGVGAMLRDEIRRAGLQAASRHPGFVFPGGDRQERRLAACGAAALWGDALISACLEAARRHLDMGSRDDWREFAIGVPDISPTEGSDRP